VTPSRHLSRRQVRQVAWVTFGAIALFVAVRRLPTGTNLAHVDFQPKGGQILQFCDPGNPCFLPVVAVKSPVTMTLETDVPPGRGRRMKVTLDLRTASGKPVGPKDLLLTHTKLLHIMVVDPSLRDYQHIHPVPGEEPGEWSMEFAPRRSGLYRFFADFTPAATGIGLYAMADMTVPGKPDLPPTADNWVFESDGWKFTLAPNVPMAARAVVNLALTVESAGVRRPIQLQPVMGTFAHLVAFDAKRSGFAHLHPQQVDLSQKLNPYRPRLTFQIQLPDPGRYVIWAQLKFDGKVRFAPFWFEVAP
jgi:hypothetical protein